MLVQAFRSELAVEGLDKRIVRWLARPREVERHSFHVGPQIQLAGYKLAALINPDRGWIADLGTDPFQHFHHIRSAEAEPRNHRRRVAAERVHDRQNTQLRTGRQLVMDEVHGPYIIDAGGRTAAFPQLCLYPSLRRLLAQLQTHLPVKPVNPLAVDRPAFALQ